MIFDKLGLPFDNGASDKEDSSRLAGLLVVFNYPAPQPIPIYKYVLTNDVGLRYYIRHPDGSQYDFSRDQAICLMAGLHIAGRPDLVDKDYITGKDIFSPSQMGHIARCQGKKPTWLQENFLWVDVLFSCYVKPKDESNQLLCMLAIADIKYLKFWLKHNKYWRESVSLYWAESYRNEKELSDFIISRLEMCI